MRRCGWGRNSRALSRKPSLAYIAGMNKQSPIVSEFETAEQEAAYVEWLKRKVAESLADPRPPVPHDQVMAEMREIIAKAKRKKAC